ncbi:MAG: hypothetical protein HUN04_10710 [Desulfobacter sp.]|nr:MAG: hypothetical protein HUN04_10710 [Desulfobacter sp.]
MDNTRQLLSISKPLEQMIDKTANEIFKIYRAKLLLEDNTYIIPGVWGTVRDGDLDDTQREIHIMASRLVDKAISAFGFNHLSSSQRFALRYLVNRTLIYTVSYMIQVTKNQVSLKQESLLMNLPPMGRA